VRWGEPRELLGRTAALLADLEAPTLVLQGRRDRVIPGGYAARTAAAVRQGRAEELDAGHFLPLDAADEVARRLAAWFA